MSVFLQIPETEWVAENSLAFAIFDRYPVSRGHSLVIPKREVGSWWEATSEEQVALMELTRAVRERLVHDYSPAGFNIGFNDGLAAGQTVNHMHLHVIPRYPGDVPNPHGGIRHVIPGKGNYLDPQAPPYFDQPQLSVPASGNFLRHLLECIGDSRFDTIDLLVSFIKMSGLAIIGNRLDEALARGARIRVLTTDYLYISDASAFTYFLDRIYDSADSGSLHIKVFTNPSISFHPKAYLFSSSHSRTGVAFVGSSNLSRSALKTGIEWNIRHHNISDLQAEFNLLWSNQSSEDLTQDFVNSYRQRKEALSNQRATTPDETADIGDPEESPSPWGVQREALRALEATRIAGFKRGLVVMATGLGKTWLAAFDSTRLAFRKVLFVAHREEILVQARDIFRRVRPDGTYSMFVGGNHGSSGDVVFASVQSLHGNLDGLAQELFDYIIIDEFHHASAPTYRKIIEHFHPQFLLGLTATPDRSDAADLISLCDDNMVYHCDLLKGIEWELLSPFKYRAIRDVADYEQIPWKNGRFDPEELSRRLETRQRSQQVLDEWIATGGPSRRCIAFCCSVSHADHMAAFFIGHGFRAASVHSGPTSAPRLQSLDALEAKDLDVLFVVDLFNEGLDIPNIDLVMMLRPTESSIVFLQQLGRGLRRSEGKEYLSVIDFVGNHRGFLLKAKILALLAGRGSLSDHESLKFLKDPRVDLPPGCSIVADIEVIDLLEQMVGLPSKTELYAATIAEWMLRHEGIRPTALQMAIEIGEAFRFKKVGGWFGFLGVNGLLSKDEEAVVKLADDFLLTLEHDTYSKSYKLLTMQAMQALGSITSWTRVGEIATSSRWRIFSDPRLMADLADANSAFVDKWNPTSREWETYWRTNPISALTGGKRGFENAWFELKDGALRCTVEIPSELRSAFDLMVSEVLEYRLHRYLSGKKMASERFTSKVVVSSSGENLDATFHLDTVGGRAVALVIDSSGGAKSSPSVNNPDYIKGFDLLLSRLKSLSALIMDAYVDSTRVQGLPVADRRLKINETSYPIDLNISDPITVRKAFGISMKKVGQKAGTKGGNSNKTVRLILSNLPEIAPELLMEKLAGKSPPTLGLTQKSV